jgi:hypothetical protein
VRSSISRQDADHRERGGFSTLQRKLGSTSDIERSILEAFQLTSHGFSVDRVIADDDLNAAFADRCREFGISGALVDWNHALFRMRKAGKMSRVPTARRTDFDWNAADQFLFASEIALHEMHARGNSLDEVLCDTKLKQQFDEVARSFAPDFQPFDYRWGALRIRKLATNSAWRKADSLVKLRMPRPIETSRFPSRKLKGNPGKYLVCRTEAVSAGSILYAGVTLDLERRLSLIFDANGISDPWKRHADSDRLFFRIFEINGSAGRSWINKFAPHQLRMIKDFKPILNFGHEYPKHRNSKRLAG